MTLTMWNCEKCVYYNFSQNGALGQTRLFILASVPRAEKFSLTQKKFQYARNVRQRSAATVFNGDSQDER